MIVIHLGDRVKDEKAQVTCSVSDDGVVSFVTPELVDTDAKALLDRIP